MSGFSSLTGGGGLSASSSAKSGDVGASSVGINIGGINTGQQSQTGSQTVLYVAMGLAALVFLRRR